MLGELPQETQVSETTEVFTPKREDVIAVVNGVNALLMEEQYKDMRVLDILTALDALAAYMRETLGIAGMSELIEDEEDA